MNRHLTTLAILAIFLFASCKKEIISNPHAPQSIQSASDKNALAVVTTESPIFSVVQNDDGTYTATLQPNATNGQDVSVNKRTDVNVSNVNFNSVPELGMSAWTINGFTDYLRAYIRFVDLVKIPATAQVFSATLYLYGENSSIFSPQGNSTYPGSPYTRYGANRCVIEPVNGPWDESTLTWNTQPKVVADWGHVSIPPSTSQWNYDVALTDVKAMVSRAVKYPDKNFGVRISLKDESIYRNMVFASSETSDPIKRPKLVVVYK